MVEPQRAIPPPSRRSPYSQQVRAPVGSLQGGPARGKLLLLASPASAFLLLFPTIGFYTLAAYVNVVAPEGSTGSIVIRAASLAILLIAWVGVPKKHRRRFGSLFLPATIFIAIYSYRLFDNIVFSEINIPPGNILVITVFFLSGIVPAYLLASIDRSINDKDMTTLLSLFSLLFVVGMILNREALMATAERRMMLDKINPIALAYVSSSLMLFYFLSFTRSKWIMFEALLIVPILLLIVSLARSRGMLISTGIALAIYLLVLKGTRRIWTLAGLAIVGATVGLYANPEYIDHVTKALGRIDTESDMSTVGRVMAFQGAWEQFLTDPFLGRYAIELSTNYYPHNIYLESLMSVGLIGTVPFMIHFGMALRAAIGLIRERNASFTRVFVALLFVRDAIGAAGSGGLWSVSGYWITSFLVIVMWYGRRQDERLLHARLRRQAVHGWQG